MIQLTPECVGIKFVLQGLMKAFANAICLGRFDLGTGMINVFQIQVEFILVMLTVATILTPPVSQDA
jgi:hypothetical protein